MDGDSLPVSAFVANANGEWEQGASAYEKRGTAVNVPEWDASKCVGCNQCAFVCSHATIRPFQLTADELAAAPAQTKSRDNRPANEYKFVMAVSPLDCMGCGECVTVCPTKAIAMVPQESQADQQAVFDYCVANISKKPSKFADDTVIGSQFNQPPAGVLWLLRRLCRDLLRSPDHSAVRREDVHLQRYRLLLYLGRYRFHLSVHRQQGQRPWSCMVQLPVRG